MTVILDEIAQAELRETGTDPEHLLEHHWQHLRQHLARGCDCLFGRDGQSALAGSSGVVLIVSEPRPGEFWISGHRP